MGRVHRALRRLLLLLIAAAALFMAYAIMRHRPQDLPWTNIDLAQPVGLFTGRKLAALTDDRAACLAALDRAGIAYSEQAAQGAGRCAFPDSIRLRAGVGDVALSPASVAPSCPVAAAIKLWEWHVVQPAAQRLYGRPVVAIRHLGSYNCRRQYGRSTGAFSEHATGDAIDIAGFVLKGGRTIRVVADWQGDGRDARFLHDVRDGACDLFSTVLSPDYNAAHRDHLHLDQAERGATGWRACR